MPFKTAVQARWNNVYQWLQETDHVDTHPEGPVFVFLERHELQDIWGNTPWIKALWSLKTRIISPTAIPATMKCVLTFLIK